MEVFVLISAATEEVKFRPQAFTMQTTQSFYIRILLLITAGISQCVAVTQKVAVEGETLILTCPLNNFDMNHRVEWRNPNGHTLFFNSHKGFQDKRTALVLLNKSQYSFSISNVTFQDAGVYKCKFYGTDHPITKRFRVTVVGAPKLEETQNEDYTEFKCTASAIVSRLRLSWIVDSGVEIERVHTKDITENVTNKHTSISHLVVKLREKRAEVRCLAKYFVQHKSQLEIVMEMINYTMGESSTSKYDSTTQIKPTIIYTTTAQFYQTIEQNSPTTEQPITEVGSTQKLITSAHTTEYLSTSEEASSTSEYQSTTAVQTETPMISESTPDLNDTTFTSAYAESDTTYSQETDVSITSDNYTTVAVNDTTELTSIHTEESTANTTTVSSNTTYGIDYGNGNVTTRSAEKGNSSLLVLMVTCLIICLIIVLLFFLARLRKAHLAWKKENEEFDQSVESSKSKSSSEEKQKQIQQTNRQSIWNTNFTKYHLEEPPETDTRTHTTFVEVISENSGHVNHHIPKPAIKETEL